MARELGSMIQKDECYLSFMAAFDEKENDAELSELIGRIQLVHMSYRHEVSKEDADQDRLKAYDEEFNALYRQVEINPHMQAFEAARGEVDRLMKKITGILTLCVRGEDPMTCDPDAESGCAGGDCGSCGGCGSN